MNPSNPDRTHCLFYNETYTDNQCEKDDCSCLIFSGNPKPDPEYSEAVKQWADEMGAMSKQQPEESEQKIKPWPLVGYAPGNYMNTCAYCKKQMERVDKLCFMCLECAVIETHKHVDHLTKRERLLSTLVAASPPTSEGKPLEVVEAAKEAELWDDFLQGIREDMTLGNSNFEVYEIYKSKFTITRKEK